MEQIESLLKRPFAYCNIDGMGELGMGFTTLGFGLLMWLQAHSPRGAVWHSVYMLFGYVGVMWLAIHYGTKAIKQRITYPRTGFVAYRKSNRMWRPMIIAFGISFVASAGLAIAARRHWDGPALGSLFGLFLAAAYAYGFARTVPWKWVVAAAMAGGTLVTAVLPASAIAAVGGDPRATYPASNGFAGTYLLCLLLYGALLTISGGISFWLYLRHTQPPAPEGA
jgi:hypothetical protein